MAAAKERVSIIRVARQPINQINPDDKDEKLDKHKSKHDHPHHLDAISPNITEQHNQPRKTKTDLFTPSVPQKSDFSNNIATRHNNNSETSQPYLSIQRQPDRTDPWIKRSSVNENRSNLIWKATGKWNNSFCSLFDDFNMCCYACSCWCCFRHELSTMMGEHWCLWFLNCSPLMELRTKFRQHYGIRGSIFEDFCLSTFCPLCVALQLANEGRHYGHRIYT